MMRTSITSSGSTTSAATRPATRCCVRSPGDCRRRCAARTSSPAMAARSSRSSVEARARWRRGPGGSVALDRRATRCPRPNGSPLRVTASLGIAVAPEGGHRTYRARPRERGRQRRSTRRSGHGRNRSVVFGDAIVHARRLEAPMMSARQEELSTAALSARLALASLGTAIAIGVVCAVGLSSLENTAEVTRVAVTQQLALIDDAAAMSAFQYQKGFVAEYLLSGNPRLARRAQDEPARLRILACPGPRQDCRSRARRSCSTRSRASTRPTTGRERTAIALHDSGKRR